MKNPLNQKIARGIFKRSALAEPTDQTSRESNPCAYYSVSILPNQSRSVAICNNATFRNMPTSPIRYESNWFNCARQIKKAGKNCWVNGSTPRTDRQPLLEPLRFIRGNRLLKPVRLTPDGVYH